MITSFVDWNANKNSCLAHYGVLGMKWGVRKDRASSGQTLLVSGSSKTQDKKSPYYRKRLPKMVKQVLKNSMRRGDTFLIGDTPGINRQVQEWLKKKHYDKVEIYGTGKDADAINRATKGLAVISDEGSRAIRANVQRMIDQNKNVRIYELNKSEYLIKGFQDPADQEIDYTGRADNREFYGYKHERKAGLKL